MPAWWLMPSFSKLDAIDPISILDHIRRLVQIESPTSYAVGVNLVLDEIEAMFRSTNSAIDRIPTVAPFGDILRIRSGSASLIPGILILAHVDTVHPLGTLAGPLSYRQVGDRVFGPGIYDMKGSVVIAIAAFRQLPADPALPITFLFTPDEEVGSPVSRRTIEEEAIKNKYVLVVEPARDGGKIVTARKGVGRFEIRAKGIPAHSGSHHERGHSAIRAIAELIVQIEAITDYERGVTTNVGRIRGGTGANVVPEDCVIEVDLRVCDDVTAREMTERIRALRCSDPEIRLSINGGLNRPPFANNESTNRLFAQAAAIASEIGLTLESVKLAGGGSDGNFTAACGIATLDGLGLDGDGAHTHHEHILFSSIIERCQLLQGLMERLR
jgi:glutamate carboxypeptidase